MSVYIFEKQTGMIKVLLYLFENKEATISQIERFDSLYHRIVSLSLDKLIELGLIAKRIDDSIRPPRELFYVTEKGEVTIIASATPKSQSLRTTIPLGIVRQFGLKEKQRLNWTIQVMGNKMVIVVAPQIQ